jgi:F-type H+-transporting ATPase subunit epsilon
VATPLIDVEIYAPERRNIQFDAHEVILPGEEGVFMVQPGHTPVLASLMAGVLIAHDAQANEDFYALTGGFAEVRNDRIVVLAQAFEHSGQIDLDRAEAARARALERLRSSEPGNDVRRAELALARATARIQAHGQEGY